VRRNTSPDLIEPHRVRVMVRSVEIGPVRPGEVFRHTRHTGLSKSESHDPVAVKVAPPQRSNVCSMKCVAHSLLHP
jgi:hypothetical protein